jgi:hypothetical protein
MQAWHGKLLIENENDVNFLIRILDRPCLYKTFSISAINVFDVTTDMSLLLKTQFLLVLHGYHGGNKIIIFKLYPQNLVYVSTFKKVTLMGTLTSPR